MSELSTEKFDKYKELEEKFIPITRTIEQTNFSLTNEYVNLADFVCLEQRYNLLLEYVKEKTGSEEKEITRFVCDKWQRANSYWCRSSIDYAFASEEEIKNAYNYEITENEETELIKKLKKIKADYLNRYKLSIWYNENKKNVTDSVQNKSEKKENNDFENELKKLKKTIIELKTVAEYYKDRYQNAKSIVDYLLNNKFISKQILAQCKPKKLAEDIERKVKGLQKWVCEKWNIKI